MGLYNPLRGVASGGLDVPLRIRILVYAGRNLKSNFLRTQYRKASGDSGRRIITMNQTEHITLMEKYLDEAKITLKAYSESLRAYREIQSKLWELAGY